MKTSPDWLRDGFDGTAEHIVLAHLSQRANNPYLAQITAPKWPCRNERRFFMPTRRITLSFPKEPTPWIEV